MGRTHYGEKITDCIQSVFFFFFFSTIALIYDIGHKYVAVFGTLGWEGFIMLKILPMIQDYVPFTTQSVLMMLIEKTLKTRGPRWRWIAHLNILEDHSQFFFFFFLRF